MTALLGTSTSNSVVAVEGDNTGGGTGVKGLTTVAGGSGVVAQINTSSGGGQGLYANSGSPGAYAIFAEGASKCIQANSYATTNAAGVVGWACQTGLATSNNIGVLGQGDAIGVSGTSTNGTGISGTSTNGTGISGTATSGKGISGTATTGTGVYGTGAIGVSGLSTTGTAVQGISSNSNGVYGSGATGVYGSSTDGTGVKGSSNTSYGAYGTSGSSYGVYGTSNTSSGVYGSTNSTSNMSGVHGVSNGVSSGSVGVLGEINALGLAGVAGYGYTSGYGVYASGAGIGLYCTGAAVFLNNVQVNGFITKSGGGYLVDHPSDPANKYLNHCFVESPEMKNVYDGVVVLDMNGTATVTMPSYFEAANSDYRYQLTAVGAAMPNLHVSAKINGGQFTVAGGVAGAEVSWQITGVRADKWALANHPGVEIDKKKQDTYLHPELFGFDDSKHVDADKPGFKRS